MRGGAFGPGNGPVYISYMDCTGSEKSVVECSHSQYGSSFCHHDQDAGVVCVGRLLSLLSQLQLLQDE